MGDAHRPTASDKNSSLFADDNSQIDIEKTKPVVDGPLWKVMIVDDDKDMHDVSTLVLKHFTYKDRGLELLHAYSGQEACELMALHPDTAVILLDVVMESDDAGLNAVKYIREELKNRAVRIILRTGQPGQAPEQQVVRQYDINDYLEKSKLTSLYFETSIITSLRSYDDICTISQLTTNNDALESIVKARTQDLSAANIMLQQKMEEQAHAHEALRRSEARLAEAQRIAKIGHFELSTSDNLMIWSTQIHRILGDAETSNSHTLTEFLEFIPKDERTQVAEKMERAIYHREAYDIEHQLIQPSGNIRYVRHQGDTVVDEKDITRIVGTLQDITARHLSDIEMLKLSMAVEQSTDGIMITDCSGIIEYINPSMEKMTGYSKDELLGQSPRVLKSNKQSDSFYQRLWNTIRQGAVFADVVINRHKSGRLYYEEKTITSQKNAQGKIVNYISTGRDITERMEAQEQLHHLAHHDALTGLPNRTLLQDRLDQAISRARWRERKVAVLFLDLDRFKVINDTLGHNVGDLILKQVSQRIANCLREGDTAARFGGDEFAIILNDIAALGDIPHVAKKIIASFELPFNYDARELFMTTSIGISLFPDDGSNGQTLLKKSDAAMYHAKKKGRNTYQLYTQKNEHLAIERLTLESDLRRALERDEFILHYQPQLDLSSCMIDGYEALLRWQHPKQGLIPPDHFIPLLEETGMIIAVGEWVLHKACAQEKSNQLSGKPPKKVAVNVSIHQFREKSFIQMVENVLAVTGLNAQYLELEVTEGVLIDEIMETGEKLKALHALGISLSIDDFGTGYSSMNYLRRLPFDVLKIDRSFVTDITTNSDDAAIAAAIITLAHSIGLKVVAEGVETMEQLCFLAKLGCDSMQGYLCSRPLPADDFNAIDSQCFIGWKELLIHDGQ